VRRPRQPQALTLWAPEPESRPEYQTAFRLRGIVQPWGELDLWGDGRNLGNFEFVHTRRSLRPVRGVSSSVKPLWNRLCCSAQHDPVAPSADFGHFEPPRLRRTDLWIDQRLQHVQEHFNHVNSAHPRMHHFLSILTLCSEGESAVQRSLSVGGGSHRNSNLTSSNSTLCPQTERPSICFDPDESGYPPLARGPYVRTRPFATVQGTVVLFPNKSVCMYVCVVVVCVCVCV
jgi:hypothetical protein